MIQNLYSTIVQEDHHVRLAPFFILAAHGRRERP